MQIGHYDTKYKHIPYLRSVPHVPSAWHPNERILAKLLREFNIKRDTAIDFGVDYGFSTAVLANYFRSVIGVDTFAGDDASWDRDPDTFYKKVEKILAPWPNIQLVKSDYQTFIKENPDCRFDLAHVDIIHDYEHTYECGLWAARHSMMTLFHDTSSYSEVLNAVVDIAQETGKRFFNFQEKCGLGILVPSLTE